MKNYIKNYLVFIILISVLIAPSFALASWYNPFSWHIWGNIWNYIFQKQTPAVQQNQNIENKEVKLTSFEITPSCFNEYSGGIIYPVGAKAIAKGKNLAKVEFWFAPPGTEMEDVLYGLSPITKNGAQWEAVLPSNMWVIDLYAVGYDSNNNKVGKITIGKSIFGPIDGGSPNAQQYPKDCKNNQTAGWKTYISDKYGFEIEYPNNLTTGEKSGKPTLMHEVPFTHENPCDFRGGGPVRSNIVDFKIIMELVNKDIQSALLSAEGLSGEKKISIGGLNGYKYTWGVEMCGNDYYYLSVAPQKTLIIKSPIITELSDITPEKERQNYLKIPGIINNKQAADLLANILSTFRFTE